MAPEPQQPPETTIWSRWRSLPRLIRLLWELGPHDMLQIAGFSLVNGLVPLLSLLMLQRLVDSAAEMIAGRTAFRVVMLWLAALFAVNVLQAVFGFYASLIDHIQERVKARAEERLLIKAGRLSLATFERPDYYDRLQRAQEGLDQRLWTVMSNLLPIPSALVTIASLLLYAGSAHILFPAIMLLGLLPATVINAHNRTFRKLFFMNHRNTSLRRMQSYLSDLMIDRQAAAEIRLFGLQAHIFERYLTIFFRLRDDRLQLARERQRALVIPGLIEALTAGAVIAGVVALVVQRKLSVGHLAAYFRAVDQLFQAFGNLFLNIASLDANLRYIEDLFDYLDIPEEVTEQAAPGGQGAAATDGGLPGTTPSPARASVTIPTIRFDMVSFAYPGTGHPVLEGIDLTLRPGERIALVGENGAGKTTLAKLLLGLYRPTDGRILVDDADLQKLDPAWWRARAAAVFQDYVRYELTVRENIGFGDLQRLHDMAAIRAAAARSGADGVVATLPADYETLLGRAYDEHGHDLSGGQWQKLAIARAYLRNAAVLVLDEPTAALDARAEVEVYRRFRDMAQGKSVLLISHRLGSARLADRILVVEHGRIVEEGSHAELLACDGRYAQMYTTQAQWYQ